MSRTPSGPSLARAVARGSIAAAVAAVLAAFRLPLFVVAAPVAAGVILVAASAAIAVVDAWPGRSGPLDQRAAAPPGPPGSGDDRPGDLVQIERALAVGGTAGGFHFQVRPIFVRVAAPVSAALTPGSILAEAVRFDRPAPDDRLGRGASADELRLMVDQLEAAWTRR